MSIQLSIIIPAYNAEKYIEETVQSALNQTIADYEILIVNDGSTDRTMDIVNRFRNEPLITIYDNRVNRGAAFAYNFGVLHARGKFITFLDADDIFLPKHCETVIDEIEKQDADIGFANLHAIEGFNPQATTLYGQPRHPAFAHFFGGETAVFPSADVVQQRRLVLQGAHISPRAIYKRSLFNDFGLEDHRLKIAHDWLRNIKFMLNGARCVYVDTPLGYYRIHNQGNSQRDPVATIVEQVKVVEIVLRENLALLTPEERDLAHLLWKQLRTNLFTIAASSDASTLEVIRWLMEKGFF